MIRTLVALAVLFALIGLIVFIGSFAEEELLWHATRSARVEGTWRMSVLGENENAPACSHSIDTVEIRIDDWVADPGRLAAAERNAVSEEPWEFVERAPTGGPWAGWRYDLLGRGQVVVDGEVTAARLVHVLEEPEGERSYGMATLLFDHGPDAGPLAGCGYSNRLDLVLVAAPGNADGAEGWARDRLGVGFGVDANGTQRPRQFVRAD